MSTETQINANRLNAQKSTGPKTPEGKSKVSQNAVTHGLTAFRPVLANEDPNEYALFRDDFFRHHTPTGILEESLAQRAADTLWRLQRAQDYETAVLNTLIAEARCAPVASKQSEDGSDGIDTVSDDHLFGQVLLDDFRKTHCLEKIQKYEMSIERSYFRTVKELRHIQSMRLGQKTSTGGTFKDVLSHNEEHPCGCSDSAISKIKPKIPPFDPMQLLENIKTNPIGLDPLTKIMMKSDHNRQFAKKAM